MTVFVGPKGLSTAPKKCTLEGTDGEGMEGDREAARALRRLLIFECCLSALAIFFILLSVLIQLGGC